MSDGGFMNKNIIVLIGVCSILFFSCIVVASDSDSDSDSKTYDTYDKKYGGYPTGRIEKPDKK
jgi:hypothetical protein